MIRLSILNFLLLSFVTIISGELSTNIFISNTNFWNKNNWHDKKLPCSQSDIHFAKSAPPVFMNSLNNLQFHEVVLPYNSELILQDGFNMLPSSSNSQYSSGCYLMTAVYAKTKPDYWYDPKNWCENDESTKKCGNTTITGIEASLIPTEKDYVILPKKSMFYISQKRNEPIIKARSIMFHGKSFYNQYRLRREFRKMQQLRKPEFFNSRTMGFPNIRLKIHTCELCVKNGNLDIMPTICAYVKCKSRPKNCLSFVKPIGSCCYLCNVKSYNLQFFDQSYRLKPIKKRVMALTLHHESFKELLFTFIVTDPIKVQFTIGVKSGKSEVLASIIPKMDDFLVQNKKNWGVVKIEGLKPAKVSGIKWKILVPIILLIILMSGLIYYFVIRRNYGVLSPSLLNLRQFNIPKITMPTININLFRNPFNRTRFFDDSEEIGTYNVVTGEFIELPETSRPTNVSFENPMYIKEESTRNFEKSESKQ